jgi:sugar phosphate isomerase/epimerase
MGPEFYADLQDLRDLNSKTAALIGRTFKNTPKTLHAPFKNFFLHDSELFKTGSSKFMDIVFGRATELGCSDIVFHTGLYMTKKSPVIGELCFDTALKNAENIGKYAEKHNIRAAFENVYDPDPKKLKALIRAGGKFCGLCFDTGHFNIFSIVPLDEWFRGIPVFEIHIHDNFGSEDSHNYPGLGIFNFKELIRCLKTYCPETGSSPLLTFEPGTIETALQGMDAFAHLIKEFQT